MAVNTLGAVIKGILSIAWQIFAGRTILSTGKGTTPEYLLRYLLEKNGLDPDKDVKIQYCSEATEVRPHRWLRRKRMPLRCCRSPM